MKFIFFLYFQARSVRGLDPLIQLLSHVVSTKGMSDKLAARNNVTQMQLDLTRSYLSETGSFQTGIRMSDKDIASIKESLKSKEVSTSKLLGGSTQSLTQTGENKRMKLKSALVKKSSNVPSLPPWCHNEDLISRDFMSVTRTQMSVHEASSARGRNEVDVGTLPLLQQEALVCHDLVCLLSGIRCAKQAFNYILPFAFVSSIKSKMNMNFSGRYIKSKELESDNEKREFSVDSCLDPSLVTFIQRFLPMLVDYSTITRFMEEKTAFEFGQVNHALCAAMRTLVKEYLIFVAQVERQKNLGKVQLQRLWYLVQPTKHTLHILASIVSDITRGTFILMSHHDACG